MNHRVEKLPILIVNPHSRCNCRCVMCDIWKTDTTREITLEQLQGQLPALEQLGVEWVVFSGGEPLMHSDLFGLCALLRRRGIRITVLSTGLLLERYGEQVAAHVDDLIVSLDGPASTHDEIRRTHQAFQRLADGVKAVHRFRPDMPVAGRCTVQKANHAVLRETIAAAKGIGLSSISFLGADLTSEAFNRTTPWPMERQNLVALSAAEVVVLEVVMEQIIAADDSFVVERAEKLRRIVNHFRAHLGESKEDAPLCNAPWVSAVLESDGSVRPCFFHKSMGNISEARLDRVVNGEQGIRFRSALDIGSDPICRTCVCSLHRAEAVSA